MTAHVSTPDAAIDRIRPGSRVVLPPSAAAPSSLLRALYTRDWGTAGLELLCSAAWPPPGMALNPTVRIKNWQLGGPSRQRFLAGEIDYVPLRYSDFAGAFGPGGPLQADVLLMQGSRPNAEGVVGPGLTGSITLDIIKSVDLVLAELNAQVPFVYSDPVVTLDDTDVVLLVDTPVPAGAPAAPSEIERRIAANFVTLVHDGATLQFGTGKVMLPIMELLQEQRHSLGIHSGMIADGVMHMMRSGAVTNSCKGLGDGATVTGMIAGSRELQRYVDGNRDILLVDSQMTHGARNLLQLRNFISLNSAIEVDLTGQVNAESMQGMQFSGIGGQADYAFAGSALRSSGGASVIALPSTAAGGSRSRIKYRLEEGAVISTPRYCVDYVVTEWGVADLRYRSLRERAQALIGVAHPSFRSSLEQQFANPGAASPASLDD